MNKTPPYKEFFDLSIANALIKAANWIAENNIEVIQISLKYLPDFDSREGVLQDVIIYFGGQPESLWTLPEKSIYYPDPIDNKREVGHG